VWRPPNKVTVRDTWSEHKYINGGLNRLRNTSSTTDDKVIVSEWVAFDIDVLLKDTDVEMKG
jgi:hypothetical protein